MTPHPPAALTAPTVVHCVVRKSDGRIVGSSFTSAYFAVLGFLNGYDVVDFSGFNADGFELRLSPEFTVEERVAIPREQYDALLRRIDLGNIDTDELLSEIRRRNVRLIFDGKHLYNAPTADALPSAAAGVE